MSRQSVLHMATRGFDVDEPVAIADAIPLYRLGVIDHLRRADISVEATDDPVGWAGQPGRRIVVISVREDEDWDVLHEVAALDGSDRIVTVAVVRHLDVELYRHASSPARGVSSPATRTPTPYSSPCGMRSTGTSSCPSRSPGGWRRRTSWSSGRRPSS